MEDWELDYDFNIESIPEKQVKQIEERKQIEQADNELTEALFHGEPTTQMVCVKPCFIEEKPKKEPVFKSEKSFGIKKQKKISEAKKKAKEHAEIFGEAELDDALDDKYYALEDKYLR